MRARAGVLLTLVVAVLLNGCVSLPRDGDVVTRPEEETLEPNEAGFDFTPSGPRPGAQPTDIVEGFLLAMQASPQTYAVAREFLTAGGRTSWNPEGATLVYGSKLLAEREGGDVRVDFEDTVQLDSRGTWVGATGGEEGIRYKLELSKEKGQWRITNPPDALIIPSPHFEARFRQYQIYFFDPTSQALVPQSVYLAEGEAVPTLLMRRLLRGPAPALEGVLRSHLPAGTELELSVPVSRDGVAEVPLSREVLSLTGEQLQLALAQVAWTLRQVGGIDRLRVTVDGVPLDVPGRSSPQSVGAYDQYDPSVEGATEELFGIRDGRVVALADGAGRFRGQFGAQEFLLRDFAVNLSGERMAGVSEDGTTVVTAPRGGKPDRTPGPDATTVVLDRGVDLLTPSWDMHGQLWMLDRTGAGARLLVRTGQTVSQVEVPGVSGRQVSAFVVSRDGTRLVAALDRRGGDQLVMARILRGRGGSVDGFVRAQPLPVGEVGVDDIRDIAWRTPSSVAVLTGPTPGSSQVLLALTDGSSGFGDSTGEAEIFRERADRVVSGPSPGMPLYIATEGRRLYELSTDGQWIGLPLRGLRAATFAG